MRNVLVTGGTRGLGLAIVERLAGAGFRVHAVARRESDAIAALRKATDGAVHFRACDLNDHGALHGLLATIAAESGPLYGLVNNAGIGTPGILATMPEAALESVIRLNTLAPILLTKYAVRSMMVGKEGRIVNIGSIVAETGYSGLSVYSASKAALGGFTRALARELGPLGITVNCVAPGFIATDMTHGIESAQLEKIMRRSALRRLAEPRDVAEAVAFLLGESGRNITGITLTVDAGNTV